MSRSISPRRRNVLVALLFALVPLAGSAQTFPLTVKAYWNPNPVSDNVTGYTIALDGGSPVSIGPASTNDVNCPMAQYPAGCILAPLSVPAAGQHSFVVIAVNQWGNSLPLTVSANINSPGQIVWVKLTK